MNNSRARYAQEPVAAYARSINAQSWRHVVFRLPIRSPIESLATAREPRNTLGATMTVETYPARRNAPVTASYARLRDVRPSGQAVAARPEGRTPAALLVALAGFLLLAAYLFITAN
jgi:hypothetical protein